VLIGRCWADYPGCILDVDAEEPHLYALATHYRAQGGALWVAGDGAGMIATRPIGAGVWEICRVYVHPDLHGAGLGHALMDTAEAYALAQGATLLELWSDTRFLRAHRFYERRGYSRGGSRLLHDLSKSEEWRYWMRSDGKDRQMSSTSY
jgi:GNAT superfamily N-acetyltransferase